MHSIFDNALPFFALIFCGYGAGRLGLLDETAAAGVNTFVFFFALPAFLFGLMSSSPIGEVVNGPFIGAYVTASLSVFALAALALGTAIYVIDRAPGSATLIPSWRAFTGAALFGAMGAWLPSFVHPFSFGLLTAAALPPASSWRLRGCAAWGAVNAAFELGQEALGAGQDELGETGQSRASDPVAAGGRTVLQLVQEDDLSLVLAGGHAHVGAPVARHREAGQLVVMRREESAAPDRVGLKSPFGGNLRARRLSSTRPTEEGGSRHALGERDP